MKCSRREFFSGASAFALGARRLFAVPPGWKPSKKPILVLGVISDTHIRTMPTSGRIDREWSEKYLVKALTHFRDENVDAVVHCGDFAHLGQVEEMQAHADAWNRAFPNNRAPAGHEVVKLFVVGNHELRGSTYGGKGMFVRRLYPDPEERALRHDYPPSTLLARMKKHPNAVGLFGHLHYSISNWRKIFLADGMPWIQVPSLHAHGYPGLREEDPWLTKLKIEGMEAAGSVRARQGMVIRLYDDMMVVERREFGEGGSLGADRVMPFGKYDPHPFSLMESKKVIGEPQFRAGANLDVFLDRIDKIEDATNHKPVNTVQEDSTSLRLCVKIPLADGNPNSRVYAYEVVVAGDVQKLHKVVYAAGCNMGIGHEPNGGVTELLIPKSDLPSGNTLAFSVCPITSLGTRGKPLSAKWTSPL